MSSNVPDRAERGAVGPRSSGDVVVGGAALIPEPEVNYLDNGGPIPNLFRQPQSTLDALYGSGLCDFPELASFCAEFRRRRSHSGENRDSSFGYLVGADRVLVFEILRRDPGDPWMVRVCRASDATVRQTVEQPDLVQRTCSGDAPRSTLTADPRLTADGYTGRFALEYQLIPSTIRKLVTHVVPNRVPAVEEAETWIQCGHQPPGSKSQLVWFFRYANGNATGAHLERSRISQTKGATDLAGHPWRVTAFRGRIDWKSAILLTGGTD